MNDSCYQCKYYDELLINEDEFPFCQCIYEEDKPEYCPEKENKDVNSTGDTRIDRRI